MNINPAKIPECLRIRKQWVLWKTVTRGDKPTKVPFQVDGTPASSTDPNTWNDFHAVYNHLAKRTDYDGVGYVFASDDDFCGIDLDGCRDPETGLLAPWAKQIVLDFASYTEVSPSQTGVKIFIRGKSPLENGKKVSVESEATSDKQPAIEVYDHARYFAMTGLRLAMSGDVKQRQDKLNELAKRFWPNEDKSAPRGSEWYAPHAVLERARKYLAKLPPAVSGQSGHNAAFRAACVLMHGFGLNESEATMLLREWSQACQPPWSEKELQHKISQAAKKGGERNYLRNVPCERWEQVKIPEYQAPPPLPEPKRTTLVDAMRKYAERLRDGKIVLLESGIPDLDYAMGGGLESSELVVVAARTSHGKSVLGLQAVHAWTEKSKPCLIISEEMSALALGKRGIQFVSEIPEEHWKYSLTQLDKDIEGYASSRAPAYIAESCVSIEAAIEEIDRAVTDNKIQLAVVDYAQILRGKGKTPTDQVAHVSMELKRAAGRHEIVIMLLCQLSREIEKRPKFLPCLADIKQSGQIEQDADVILFLVWPHKIDQKQPANEYQIFVAKNRNRAINQTMIKCRFLPSRQMIVMQSAKQMPNYTPAFDTFTYGSVPDGFDEALDTWEPNRE